MSFSLGRFFAGNRSLLFAPKEGEEAVVIFWGGLMRPVYENFNSLIENLKTSPNKVKVIFNELGQRITVRDAEEISAGIKTTANRL